MPERLSLDREGAFLIEIVRRAPEIIQSPEPFFTQCLYKEVMPPLPSASVHQYLKEDVLPDNAGVYRVLNLVVRVYPGLERKPPQERSAKGVDR